MKFYLTDPVDIKVMLEAYETGGEQGGIDRLYLLHNVFENTMSQKPVAKTLIPVEAPDEDDLPKHWDYIYEPDASGLLDNVLDRYIESQVYRGAVENFACEMAAKMVAMKSATDNAGEIIDKLQLDYNKARQAAITQEISEIVGGAANNQLARSEHGVRLHEHRHHDHPSIVVLPEAIEPVPVPS